MTFRIKYCITIIAGCISVSLITACVPKVQKPDDAFDILKKERMLTNDSSFVSKEIIDASMKTVLEKKIETPDEWTKFKLETESKIRLNEKTIKEIKGLSNANSSQLKKVTNLEKDNNDLRIQMDKYREEMKLKWETFKTTMNHNVTEIGIELNSLKLNSKK